MSDKKTMSFEDKLKRLEEVTEKIEGEDLPLQEVLSLYEEGKKLAMELQKELKEAEEKVAELNVSTDDLK
jgi:exodeoxyribonuclease VII small subunit